MPTLRRILLTLALLTVAHRTAQAQTLVYPMPTELNGWQRCLADMVMQGRYGDVARASELWDLSSEDLLQTAMIRDLAVSLGIHYSTNSSEKRLAFHGFNGKTSHLADAYFKQHVGKELTLDLPGGPRREIIHADDRTPVNYYLDMAHLDFGGRPKQKRHGLRFDMLPTDTQLELIKASSTPIPNTLVAAIHFRAGDEKAAYDVLQKETGILPHLIMLRRRELAADPPKKHRPPRILYSRAAKLRAKVIADSDLPANTGDAVDRYLAMMAERQATLGFFTDQPDMDATIALAFLANGHFPGYGDFGPVLERYYWTEGVQNHRGSIAAKALFHTEVAAFTGNPIHRFHAQCALRRLMENQAPNGLFGSAPEKSDTMQTVMGAQALMLAMFLDIDRDAAKTALDTLRNQFDRDAYDRGAKTIAASRPHSHGIDDARFLVLMHLLGVTRHPMDRLAVKRVQETLSAATADPPAIQINSYAGFGEAVAIQGGDLQALYRSKVLAPLLSQQKDDGNWGVYYSLGPAQALDISGAWRFDWDALGSVAQRLAR